MTVAGDTGGEARSSLPLLILVIHSPQTFAMCPFPSSLPTSCAFLVPMPLSNCPQLIHCWTIFQPCHSIFSTVPDEVILGIDMLCTCMMLWIVCEGDSTLIVAIYGVLIADIVADLFEEAL